jgi:hypothetical protein
MCHFQYVCSFSFPSGNVIAWIAELEKARIKKLRILRRHKEQKNDGKNDDEDLGKDESGIVHCIGIS